MNCQSSSLTLSATCAALFTACSSPAMAAGAAPVSAPHLLGISAEFYVFAATLAGIAVFHHRTLQVALAGLAATVALKLSTVGFKTGPGLVGLAHHLSHEWVTLANLFLLLTGFALLSRHFEESHIPAIMPAVLPDDWRGGFSLLALVFVLSAFLDNIAAAIIGGTVARAVYRGRVHIGFLAAIVAASNAGGSGSVVGDTTTTMMWIAGAHPVDVLHAYVAAITAFAVFSLPAARVQQDYQPITKDAPAGLTIEWARVAIVATILIAVIGANIAANSLAPHLLDLLPMIGLSVWAVLLLTAPVRRPDWSILPETTQGTIFLLALVMAASLMPVEELPPPSWQTAFGLGFVSSVFDNIPLTALALKQGGYDWGMLAYAVGFGGSMVWFGSSAGVALSNLFPEAKSVGRWVTAGWPIAAGYVVGYFVLLTILGWQPHELAR